MARSVVVTAAASSLYPPPGLPSPPHAATERNLAQRPSNPTPLRWSPSNFPGAAMGRSKHPTTPFPSSSSISSSDLPFFSTMGKARISSLKATKLQSFKVQNRKEEILPPMERLANLSRSRQYF